MNLARLTRRALAAAVLLCAPLAGWAVFDPVNDDTDIFLANPTFNATRPNVLIFVDNTSNWSAAVDATSTPRTITSLTQSAGTATAVSAGHGYSTNDQIRIAGATPADYNVTAAITKIDDDSFSFAVPAATASPATGTITANMVPYDKKFDAVKAGLLGAIPTVMTDEYNVGLASFTETGQDNGVYIRYGVRQMTATSRPALSSMVNSLTRLGDNTNNGAFSMAMAEMYSYFAGASTYTTGGRTATKRDYKDNANATGGALADGHALASATATTYTSPIADNCQKNFIIFISNGTSTVNADNSATESYLATLKGATPTQIQLNPRGSEADWSDEYAEFMSNSDCNPTLDGVQNVYTYTIDILPTTKLQELQHTALLKSMAAKGKGKYFAVTDMTTTSQFEGILKTIFQEVQAVNSVFASTTLPVSVNVRGTNLNQVYIGVFRPDAAKSPRWLGNLKLYRLGVDTSTEPATLFLADAAGLAAENSSTGFITGSARSYWTEASTYWSYRDNALNGVGLTSDSPDGDLVEKGGAAQRLRLAYPTDQSGRSLYTCVNATLTGNCAAGALLSATPFNSANVSAGEMGSFTTYSVGTLSASGTTATLRLGAAPSPTWAAGDLVTVAGATPDVFNGTFNLATADNATFTYTFTLPSAPDANTAQATGTSHGLQTGDLVTVTGTASLDAADASVTRVDGNNFRYPRASASGAVGATTAVGKKAITSLTGSGFTATAVVPAHGYTGSPSVTISGAVEAMFNVTNAPITIVDANSFTYSTSPTPIVGTTTVAKVTALGHNLNNNQSNVYIIGNVNSGGTATGYNNTAVTVSKLDNNSVTFPSASGDIGTASGAIGFKITNMDRGTGGAGGATNCNGRDVLTVTLANNHNITTFPFSITIAGGTGSFAPYNGTWTIASSADAPASPGNTFVIQHSSGTNAANGACNFDAGDEGTPSTTMVAGKPITGGIVPTTTATTLTTMYSAKNVSLSGITALSNATGTMTVGRPTDGDTAERDRVVAWVRGADNKDNENPNTTPAGSDIRPSIHGDVLHSRPAVVNYNRYGDDNDIYAFYGGNDGIFRALKGGIAAHSTGADASLTPGIERWGFVPREFFGKLKRLRDQSPTISAANQKDYFADGSIGVYQNDAKGNGTAGSPLNCVPGSCSGADTVSGVLGDNIHATHGDKVYLYVSMRRGGDFVYALDVTNPAAPKLLWHKSSASTGWEQIGQTWSEPKLAKLEASIGNASNPNNVVMIMGAGYDDALEDINPCLLDNWTLDGVTQKAVGSGIVTYTAAGSCTVTSPTGTATSVSRTKGRGIVVVDAFDGTVVWQAGANVTTSSTSRAMKLNVPDMKCAISSDTTVLDKNRDGFADRIYVGDLCGQVWRVDITKTDMLEWTVTKVASLSTGGATDIINKRKFQFPPDLVFSTDSIGNYTAVLLGSGDREHPFDTTVVNRFYMLKDRDSADIGDPQSGATNATSVKISGWGGSDPTGDPIVDADVFDATNTVLVDATDPLGQKGWKITMAAGEKIISSAVTISGTTFFNTNQPEASAGGGSCGSNLGIAREYQVGFADAAATQDLNQQDGVTIADRAQIHAGGGYLPSPVPVVVEIDGTKYQAVISGTSVQNPPGLTLEKRTRVYWYKDVD